MSTWRIAFKAAGNLEQLAAGCSQFFQRLHQSICLHLNRVKTFGELSCKRDAFLDEFDRFVRIGCFGQASCCQFFFENLHCQCRSRKVLADTVMQILANAALLAFADFEQFEFEAFTFGHFHSKRHGSLFHPGFQFLLQGTQPC